jgi:amidase
MMGRRRGAGLAAVMVSVPLLLTWSPPVAAASKKFTVYEATIADVHKALATRAVTCEGVVQGYLDRIDAYEDNGPAVNAVITVNDNALADARAFDRAFRRSPRLKNQLACIPMLIKDNVDTADLPTTGGSLALRNFVPRQDATVVARLRKAGAIILAKANLDEFARGSSRLSGLGGQTRNPYDPERIAGGSSAGVGAGIAASFATVGIGTETGVSIRNPATNGSLVGIAPTRGLVSSAGIIPISFTQDRAGPIARSTADAARVLQVIAGYDPRDPQTALAFGRLPDSFTIRTGRPPTGLRGARIGVVRELFGAKPAEAESASIVDAAVVELKKQGAVVIEDVPLQAALDTRLPVLDPLYPNQDRSVVRALSDARTNNYEQRTAMDAYLAAAGPDVPYEDLTELIASGLVLPSVASGFAASDVMGLDDPEYIERLLRISALQAATTSVMAQLDLDALVYPMKTQVAPLIGGQSEPGTTPAAGNILSPITGFPAVVVPAGFTSAGMPVGIEFLGLPFTEDLLVRLAHHYEIVTDHREPPASTPALPAAPRGRK